MNDLNHWLAQLELEQHAQAFIDNDISLDVLPEITDQDLKDIGISIGHRRKLLAAIKLLSTPIQPAKQAPVATEQANKTALVDDAEHRQLTVLFCDLVGSTDLSRQLDNEDLREVMIAYQRACKAAIQRHEGFVARYMGDGLLVYFGYPQAHEDDAQLAVHAGLAIVDAIKELNKSIGQSKGVLYAVRVGIATGPVIVGDLIGDGTSRENAVVGETPNLAARLQSGAAPDQVIISPSTYRLTKGHFRTNALEPRAIKGWPEPIETWHVTGTRQSATRFDIRDEENMIPLIGRQEELSILMRRWDLCRQDKGQVIFISGEPGIGKSRLVQAFRQSTSAEPQVRLRYQCSQHHTNSALFPFFAQFEYAAGITGTDTGEQKLDKLAGLLDSMNDRDETHLSLLASLFSIPLNDRVKPFEGDARQQRQATLLMLQMHLELLCSTQPVLCVFEDIHWIDPSSIEVLDRLVERINVLPVMLILSFRTSFNCPWAGLSHTTLMALNRMDRSETLAIVEELTAGCELPEAIIEHIVSRTDGVPLFVEELTKMLLETGYDAAAKSGNISKDAIEKVYLPETLRDSLMARLDRLGSAKPIAQICAVIGRSVHHSLLQKVSDLDVDRLDEVLEKLVSADLMSRRGSPPDAVYTFNHALIQDTAYQSMLRTKRTAIHSQIADALHEHFPLELEQKPEIIAHHYLLGERLPLALDYLERAAQRALSRSNYVEAIHYLKQALEIIEREPASAQRDEREVGVQTALGGAMIATRGFAAPETGEAYNRAADLVRGIGGDTSRFNPVRYGVWVFNLVRSEFGLAHELAEDFIAVADSQTNPTEHLVAHRTMGSCLTFMGQWKEAINHLQQALALYERRVHDSLAITYAQDPRIAALALSSWALLHLGRYDDAIESADTAVAEALAFKHLHTTAYTLGLAGTMFHQFRGDLQRTREGADTLVELCSRQPVPLWSSLAFCLQGWAIGMDGATDRGIKQLQAGYDGFIGTGARLFMPYYNALKAQVYVKGGDHKMALQCLQDARNLFDANEEGWFAADFHRINGDLCRAMNLTARANAAYESGLQISRSEDDLLNQLRCLMGLAEMSETALARQAMHYRLEQIYERFSQGHNSPDLVRARVILESF